MSDTEKEELYRQILKEKKKKNNAVLKKKLRTKIFFICIVAATLVLLFVVNSLAWFSWGAIDSIEPLDIKVTTAPSIQISEYPAVTWGTTLDVSFYPLKPICGDGISFFDPVYTDVLIQQSDSNVLVYEKQVTAYSKLADMDETSMRALVKDFQIRTNINQSKLYLSPASYLTADITASESSSINSSSLNTGHIAAAMRAAIYMEIGGTETLLCYWIPNYNGHLKLDTNGLPVVENYTVDDGIVTYYDTWQSEGDEHDYESEYILVNTAGTIGSGGTATSTAIAVTSSGYVKKDGVLYVWDLQKAYDDGMYIYDNIQTDTSYKMKLVIWVDGTDRECDNALLGGKMNLVINFKQGE